MARRQPTRIVRTGKLEAARELAKAWEASTGEPVSVREAVDGAVVVAGRLVEHVGLPFPADAVEAPRGGYGTKPSKAKAAGEDAR